MRHILTGYEPEGTGFMRFTFVAQRDGSNLKEFVHANFSIGHSSKQIGVLLYIYVNEYVYLVSCSQPVTKFGYSLRERGISISIENEINILLIGKYSEAWKSIMKHRISKTICIAQATTWCIINWWCMKLIWIRSHQWYRYQSEARAGPRVTINEYCSSTEIVTKL